jgi:energy-converting hydrogenase Eha subunit A
LTIHERGVRVGVLAALVVVGGGALLYLAQELNLPEEMGVLIAAACATGLVVGRWPMVLSSLPILGLPFFLGEKPADEDWRLAMIIYLPIVALSLTAGILLHLAVRRLVRYWGTHEAE